MKSLNINCAKCGEVLELSRVYKQRYCKKCHAEYMRENRVKYKNLSPDAKLKSNARAYANVYQNQYGRLVKQPCEKCGNENTEKHHEDYSKPLEVIWLCRQCHLDHHKNQLTFHIQHTQVSNSIN
jgi:ribosomal protein S27AE